MKRHGLLVAALTLVLIACESNTSGVRATLGGVHDIAAVGRLLFVASAQNSELRVLDTQSDVSTGREGPGFVRAPNPIAILSIPVLDRPMALTPDIHFDGEGAEVKGPYLYVQGAGAREISVVGAEPEILKELVRLPTNGPVTALAGVGPQNAGEESLLFYADWQGARSRLLRVALPDPEVLAGTPPSSGVLDLSGAPVAFTGQSVSAMTTLPRAADGSVRLAIGLRDEGGKAGRALLLTLDVTGTQYVQAPVELDFGGPVRMLKTHPRVTRTVGSGDNAIELEVLPAGARIFAALDESACNDAPSCGGVVAVDGITLDRTDLPDLTLGQRSLDARGLPMVAIETAGDVLQDFEVMPKLSRLAAFGAATGEILPLGGVISSGAGYFTLFDALALTPINASSDLPTLSLDGMSYFDPAGNPLSIPVQVTGSALVDPATLRLNHGVVREEIISITYQPDLPGLTDLELDATGEGDALITATGVRLADPSLASRVRVGDAVTLGGAGCAQSATVDAVDEVVGALTLSSAPLAACTRLTVAAGVSQPWVVFGGQSGYLGRTADGEVFASIEGKPFAHPEAYVPGAPQLQFTFRTPPGLTPVKGTYLLFSTIDGFAFQRSRITNDPRTGVFWQPPGSMVLLPENPDFPYGSVWVTFPSFNTVAAFAPTAILPGLPVLAVDVRQFQ